LLARFTYHNQRKKSLKIKNVSMPMERHYRQKVPRSDQKKFHSCDFTFQAFEWQDGDEEYQSVDNPADDSDNESGDSGNEEEKDTFTYKKRYIVRIFGVNSKSQSVCVTVQDYTPFFFIKVPQYFNAFHLEYLLAFIEGRKFTLDRTSYFYKNCLLRHLCRIEEKKSFYGFHNGETFKFVRLVFSSLEAMKRASYIFNYPVKIESIDVRKPLKFEKFETNVDQLIRFIHTRNLEAAGWITIQKGHSYVDTANGDCQINLLCNWLYVDPYESSDIAPAIQASFDIECFSHDYSFPNPSVPENVVTAIATAFKRYGEPDFFLKHVITLKTSNPLQNVSGNVILECYDTEKEVLLAWTRLIKGMDPDIIYSYNGDQFDCNYLIARSKMPNVNCFKDFSKLSRVNNHKCDIHVNTFQSGAHGSTEFLRLPIPGRINFDILIYFKREIKLESYKLDTVAEKFLGEKKHDVSVAQIFDYFRSGDPEKIRIITEYCVQDTLLPQRLVDKLDILPIQVEMSRITYVPIRYLIEKGQQIKVFSQILKRTRKAGFLIPHLAAGEDADLSFKGGYVLDPEIGAHWSPVATLDFASLYPTIMMAHNFCYSTIVLDPKYLDLPGVEYHTVKWSQPICDDENEETGECTSVIKSGMRKDAKCGNPGVLVKGEFLCKMHNKPKATTLAVDMTATVAPPPPVPMQTHTFSFAINTEAILPTLLSELYKSRKMVKKLMGSEKDPFKKSVLNGRQLAIKVSMNSVYGFLAAQKLCCKPIAACVTATGRQMIDETRTYAETEFVDFALSSGLCKKLKSKVVYGDTDSVFVSFDTGLNGLDAMRESFKLAKVCADMATKRLFKPPIMLEFEKVYSMLLIFKKKMYIGNLHEKSPEVADCIDIKGIAMKRRDSCSLLKTIYSGALDIVVEKKQDGVEEAIQFIQKWMKDLVANKVEMSQLTVSKRLNGGYAVDCHTPHVVLAEKMFKRDAGSAPKPGDRVPYVFIDTGNKADTQQYKKVEDPEYVKKHNLKLDVIYYIEKQLKNPLTQFLSIFQDDPGVIFRNAIKEAQATTVQKGQGKISSFFTLKE
jgi:DNA polymerase elongation subunit (family B)